MTSVFFGSSKYVLPIISVLRNFFNLSLVITTEKNPNEAVSSYCISHHVPYRSVDRLDKKTIEKIKETEPEFAVLAYFGIILPSKALSLFKKGILNLHPSLLPLYRGPTPVQTTILEGDRETGVTIIKLDSEVDHGPILGQEKEPVFSNDTTDTLHSRLFEKGAHFLKETINRYLQGDLIPQKQNHRKATFTNHLTRKSGYIDRVTPPKPLILKRMINAYYPWPGVWTELDIQGKKTRLKLLPGEKVQLQDKKVVSYKDFYNGYPNLKGKLENLLV